MQVDRAPCFPGKLAEKPTLTYPGKMCNVLEHYGKNLTSTQLLKMGCPQRVAVEAGVGRVGCGQQLQCWVPAGAHIGRVMTPCVQAAEEPS